VGGIVRKGEEDVGRGEFEDWISCAGFFFPFVFALVPLAHCNLSIRERLC